jgi:hypothetical protein
MANAVLLIGADRPIPGREEEAMALLPEIRAQLDKWEKAGWYERHDVVFLTAHGGDLNSAFLLYGERAKLDELRRTDEFEALIFRTGNCLARLGVVPGVTGQGLDAAMARRKQAVAK